MPGEVLQKLAPFDRLDGELWARVRTLVEPFRAGPRQWLVRQGAAPSGDLLVLTAGTASVVAESGVEEHVLGVLGPGDMVGVTGALTGEPHPVSVRAGTAVEGVRIPAPALELCLTSPAFAAHVTRSVAQRLRATYAEVARDAQLQPLEAEQVLRPVSALMRSPVTACTPDTPAGAVAQLLRDRHISSAVVVEEGRLRGIVTDTDLVNRVLAEGRPADTPVETVMTAPVEWASPDTPYHEALLRMLQGGFKHLPVLDASGQVTGLVTLGDLARARGEGGLAVATRLDRAPDVAQLAAAVQGADHVLRLMVEEGAGTAQTLAVMTSLHDRVLRRLIQLGQEQLGEPPCDWCWLVMGSAGREEQFARTDQDHGLVYTGSPATADGYFEALAAFVVDGLEQCGFPRCPGDVMPTNPVWRRSLEEWRLQVLTMVERPHPEHIRHATIFLDFRPVAGNRRLAEALREQLWVVVEAMPLFLYHLVRDDLSHPVPLGLFKSIRTPMWGTHKGEINLKADACVHVVDLLRALALQYRVPATSTLGRLKALVELRVVGRNEGDWLETAYQTLMRLRMQDTVRRRQAGEPVSAYVSVATLKEPEREALREALVAVSRLQETVGAALAPGGRQ